MIPLTIHWPTQGVGAVIAVLYVLLALAVTADVLLKKSDVRAALGWISAAWLSPLIGSLLYFLLGINRVTRRAMKLGRRQEGQQAPAAADSAITAAPNIALLEQVSGRITREPLTAGNHFDLLEGGDQAYPAMLAAIEAAKRSVALASYIFRDDAAGRKFCDALIAAHARGVAVRVLLDGVGVGYIHSALLGRLRRGGVIAERFLHTWLPWRMPFLNMRNHRKILVVDGAIAFVGGINIGAENVTALSPRGAIGDVHFRIAGPVVRMVMDAFARDWSFTADETLDDDCWWPQLAAAGSTSARGLRSGPDADIYRLEAILGAALTLARERVRIVTPYFLPDSRLQFAIAQAGLRGVKVEIVLPVKSDQRIMDWAMRAHLRFFRHIRATLFATPAPFDHSKLCTVDGEWCLIGSSNWDARSFRLNFEFDLECIDAEMTARVDALIDRKIAAATPLSPDALIACPLWTRLRDAAARLMMPYL